MRLFVTVGTQFPFDRLVRAVDEWAGRNPAAAVFAQVGPTQYVPRHLDWAPFIDAGECRAQVEHADLIVAHAGMGSIITALESGKPIIVMPRRAELREHRNDHQMATARSLLAQGKVIVAFDESHLREKLEHLDQLAASRRVSAHASPRLLATLREFVSSGSLPLHLAPATSGGAAASVTAALFAEPPEHLDPACYRTHGSELNVLLDQPTLG